jgi:hypothetical protein
MDLKDFVKSVLVDINEGVDEARDVTSRDIRFAGNSSKRTIEFDVAVSVEKSDSATGKAGVRVLKFAEADGELSKSMKNSTVSHICFGLHIDSWTKEENRTVQAEEF